MTTIDSKSSVKVSINTIICGNYTSFDLSNIIDYIQKTDDVLNLEHVFISSSNLIRQDIIYIAYQCGRHAIELSKIISENLECLDESSLYCAIDFLQACASFGGAIPENIEIYFDNPDKEISRKAQDIAIRGLKS